MRDPIQVIDRDRDLFSDVIQGVGRNVDAISSPDGLNAERFDSNFDEEESNDEKIGLTFLITRRTRPASTRTGS